MNFSAKILLIISLVAAVNSLEQTGLNFDSIGHISVYDDKSNVLLPTGEPNCNILINWKFKHKHYQYPNRYFVCDGFVVKEQFCDGSQYFDSSLQKCMELLDTENENEVHFRNNLEYQSSGSFV